VFQWEGQQVVMVDTQVADVDRWRSRLSGKRLELEVKKSSYEGART